MQALKRSAVAALPVSGSRFTRLEIRRVLHGQGGCGCHRLPQTRRWQSHVVPSTAEAVAGEDCRRRWAADQDTADCQSVAEPAASDGAPQGFDLSALDIRVGRCVRA